MCGFVSLAIQTTNERMIESDPTCNPNFPLILIVGPTAVGKTKLNSTESERRDSSGLPLLSRHGHCTATPSRRAGAPHYLIDIVNPDETLSLAIFQQKAKDIIADIHARGKLPFLVGGTGQYMRAVTQGWTPPEVTKDERLRDELEKLALSKAKGLEDEKGANWLHDRLAG
jgi:tRNA dimethylallyltransferase